MKKGRAGTMTHDYKRHDTTTLFAALNVLDGSVIGRNMQRYRHQEFIRFLITIEAQLGVVGLQLRRDVDSCCQYPASWAGSYGSANGNGEAYPFRDRKFSRPAPCRCEWLPELLPAGLSALRKASPFQAGRRRIGHLGRPDH